MAHHYCCRALHAVRKTLSCSRPSAKWCTSCCRRPAWIGWVFYRLALAAALQSMSDVFVSCALAHSLVREPCSEQGQAAGVCGQARLDLGLRHACLHRCKVMRRAALGPATQPCISLCSACRTRSETHGMHQHKPCCTSCQRIGAGAPQLNWQRLEMRSARRSIIFLAYLLHSEASFALSAAHLPIPKRRERLAMHPSNVMHMCYE